MKGVRRGKRAGEEGRRRRLKREGRRGKMRRSKRRKVARQTKYTRRNEGISGRNGTGNKEEQRTGEIQYKDAKQQTALSK